MATRTIADGGGNWTANGTWVEGLAPTALDDVVATATSGNVTVDSGAVCQSANFAGYVGVLTFSSVLTIGSALGGSLTLVSGMTVTPTSGGCTFASTTTGNTITTAGKSLRNMTFSGVGGGWTLQDDLTLINTGEVSHTAGTLVTNGKTVTCDRFKSTTAGIKTLTLGASSIVLGGSSTVWDATGTNLTFSGASSTITVTAGGTFAGGGRTYGTLAITGATSASAITGANTFAALNWSAAVSGTLTLPASTTTTVTTVTMAGHSGKLLTLVSSSGGTAATVSVAAGTVRVNHCSIKDVTGTGGATFEAYDSINVSGNTGVSFIAAKRAALCGVGT